MEIILQQDLDELGLEGDIVNVAKGFARNYLIPKGFGLEATPQNIKALELKSKKIEVKRLRAKEEAEKVKEKMAEIVLTFSQKTGAEGKLFGSVTSMDIASGLEKQNVVVNRKKIVLEKPIKTVGEFEVPVRIYPGVIGTVKVHVSPEEKKEG